MPELADGAVGGPWVTATDMAQVAPAPFTENALAQLRATVNEFIADLINESFRIAKRHRSEVVSVRYVESAATYLVASRARRIFRHFGTIGGILVGGSLSNILAMAQNSQALPVVGSLVSVAVGIVGTFLVAIHIAKD